MALIEFKNVNKYYGDYHALRDINLEIEKGQVVVLLGPSGSGKSTLIRTINALESVRQTPKRQLKNSFATLTCGTRKILILVCFLVGKNNVSLLPVVLP